jgi:excisionase family DNA binding protein
MGNHVTQAYAERRSEPLMTVDETAAFLKVSRRQVYRLLDNGELPAVRVGTRIRVDPDALLASLRAIESSESAEPAVAGSKARRDLNRGRDYHRAPSTD